MTISSGRVLDRHSVAQRLHVDRAQRQHGIIRNSAGDLHPGQVRHRGLHIAPLELAIDDLEDVLALGVLADGFSRER